MSTSTAAPRRGLSVAVLLTGVFVSSLDLFIVNIAFPDLALSFPGSSLTSLSWVLSAYAIAFAALLMPAGRWADRSGPQAGVPDRPRPVHAGVGDLRRGAVAGGAGGGAGAAGRRRWR